jgi:hypothetical protein
MDKVANICDELIVDACLDKFMTFCQGNFRILRPCCIPSHHSLVMEVDLSTDLKVFDSAYLQEVYGQLNDEIQLHIAQHNLNIMVI